MAEAVFHDFEDTLKCPRGQHTYSSPVRLHCLHVYCLKCLADARDSSSSSVTCPTCLQATPIPKGGVAELQPASYIRLLLDIRESFMLITPLSAVVYCSDHHEKLKLDCKKCKEFMCCECIITGQKHDGHKYKVLSEEFKDYKKATEPYVDVLDHQVSDAEGALSDLDTRSQEVSDQRADIERKIRDVTAKLHRTLDHRMSELIGGLEQTARAKLGSLATQRAHAETTRAQLGSFLGLLHASVEPGGKGGMLKRKTSLLKQVKDLSQAFEWDLLRPSEEANMAYEHSSRVESECKDHGRVLVKQLRT